MPKNFSGQTQGFLLIEVVIALAIFAVATAIVSQSFANGLMAKYQRETSLDASDKLLFLVDRVLEEFQQKEFVDARPILTNGGTMHFPDESCWQWKMDCKETDILGLFQISLALTLPTDKEEYQFYRYVSKWTTIDQKSKSKERFERLKKDRFKGVG
jgi:prepilin-type N-terminal cleavage/methylation domain-containing protein